MLFIFLHANLDINSEPAKGTLSCQRKIKTMAGLGKTNRNRQSDESIIAKSSPEQTDYVLKEHTCAKRLNMSTAESNYGKEASADRFCEKLHTIFK
jgi:hypothetical protein